VKKKRREMSFLNHLEELRWRIVKIAIAVTVTSIPCGIFWKQICNIVMLYPLRLSNPRPHLYYNSPIEGVMLSFKIAIGAGVIVAAPVLFYQIWRFIAPGLFANEKKIVLPTVIASSLAFICGIVFCYLWLPHLFKILTSYAQSLADPMFTIGNYFNFILKLSIAFGLVFELPVVSFVCTRIGIMPRTFLVRHWRIAIIIIFIVAAILTPPEPISQILMAIPLLFLYGVSIITSLLAGRKA
jgi:sec-independent protein translocase protein TatC